MTVFCDYSGLLNSRAPLSREVFVRGLPPKAAEYRARKVPK